MDNFATFPRSRVIGSAHCVMDVTHGQTDRKFMYLHIPSPKHIITNHPFYFFAFGKEVVDGKNIARSPEMILMRLRKKKNYAET